MATVFEQIASTLGLSNSQALASGSTAPSGTENAAFNLNVENTGSGHEIILGASGGSTLIAPTDQGTILIGGTGNNHLVGGDQPDLLIGGKGTNVMTGGGGADVFGHTAGATDVLTDFSPTSGEHIAVQNGISFTSAATTNVNPTSFGLSGSPVQSEVLTFSDGSHVVLLGSTATPESSWFV